MYGLTFKRDYARLKTIRGKYYYPYTSQGTPAMHLKKKRARDAAESTKRFRMRAKRRLEKFKDEEIRKIFFDRYGALKKISIGTTKDKDG